MTTTSWISYLKPQEKSKTPVADLLKKHNVKPKRTATSIFSDFETRYPRIGNIDISTGGNAGYSNSGIANYNMIDTVISNNLMYGNNNVNPDAYQEVLEKLKRPASVQRVDTQIEADNKLMKEAMFRFYELIYGSKAGTLVEAIKGIQDGLEKGMDNVCMNTVYRKAREELKQVSEVI